MIIAEVAAQGSFWSDYLHTQFDPAHLLSEIGVNVAEFLVVALLWSKTIKPWMLRNFSRQVHEQFDIDHGINHEPTLQHPVKQYQNRDPVTKSFHPTPSARPPNSSPPST